MYSPTQDLQFFDTIPVKKKRSVLSLFLFSAAGSLIGIIISFIVNAALVELTLNPFFSIYFALLSISIGAIIYWRVVNRETPDPDNVYQKQLATFSYIVISSGIFCFFLTQKWFPSLPSLFKILIYSILGISVSFTLSFTLVDVLNVVVGLFQSSAAKPLVQSLSQIRLVVFMTILMGGAFGTIFGLMDVEDSLESSIQFALMREENYCYPIGAVLGALAGFGMEYLRESEVAWTRVNHSEFDEDI